LTDPKPHRNTRQRQVVLEELQMVPSHPTAAELHARVRRRLPRISLGTVYRNLELLNRQGIIQKLDLGGGEARFDGNVRHHEHVRCVRCGRVDDVGTLPEGRSAADLARREPASAGGYQILGYRLEFLGVCPDCAAADSDAGFPPHGQEE